MGGRLAVSTVVTVPHGEGDNGEGFRVFLAGDDNVPEWAAENIGAHCFEDGKHPFPKSNYPGKKGATAAVTTTTTGNDGGPPPRSGKGSGAEAWHEYAAAQHVDVDPDANREEVIAALEEAGVAVDAE